MPLSKGEGTCEVVSLESKSASSSCFTVATLLEGSSPETDRVISYWRPRLQKLVDDAGVKVTELANTLKAKAANLHVWFATTGKTPAIKKAGKGHYKLVKK